MEFLNLLFYFWIFYWVMDMECWVRERLIYRFWIRIVVFYVLYCWGFFKDFVDFLIGCLEFKFCDKIKDLVVGVEGGWIREIMYKYVRIIFSFLFGEYNLL